MSDYLFLEQFSKPIEAKRMNARERSTLTDILYGMPDKDLLVQFAPLNTYPIGFRFNLAGLREALETFDCKTLIRGCGHRDSNGADFDFDEDSCISVVSGRSIVYTNHEINAFINNCGYELRSTPCNFLFDLPNGCAACEWIGQEKKPENVTISHALLKSFTEGNK
uniref:Fe-S oxidoreductase n=1 Tax=Elaeophora elaphi TaxID=1147741 RepID=A0A0R3RN85_9BILA